MAVSDQIRKAIDTCGISRYRIAQETGVAEATLSRFMAGQRGLSMEAIDRLADYLHYRLTKAKDQ